MRLKFERNEQRNFLNYVLINNGLNLREFSNNLNVNYSTMKNFYQETRTIPECLIDDICNFYSLKFPNDKIETELVNSWGQVKGGKKGIKTTYRRHKSKLSEWRSKVARILLQQEIIFYLLKLMKILQNFMVFFVEMDVFILMKLVFV
tara:strand:+ start:428 stop:871 length:444 start_codon:yes stop_codon:yes gene_type:complete